MKVNFATVLTGLDGEPIKTPPVGTGEPGVLTLADAAKNALMNIEQGEDGAAKFKCWELAMKANGEVELTAEEAALIKKKIGNIYSPLVVGPAYKLLNG